MGFAILATFPLGTYRGRRPDGALDLIPSPGRLHAALLNAAAQGIRAELVDGRLRPSEPDREAIAWTEANPPDGMRIPHMLQNRASVIAYRAPGLWQNWKQSPREGKGAGCVAVDGHVGWIWEREPPAQIAESLAGLCADVPYMGTTESPVVLRVGQADPTHLRDLDATAFTERDPTSLDLEVPTPGRARVLESAFLEAQAVSKTETGVKTTESELPSRVDRTGLVMARYVPVGDLQVDVAVASPPWDRAVVIPMDGPAPTAAHRVAWAVALHRALIALIGDGAPGLVTGRYEPGVKPPANRLAIQFVDGSVPVGFDLDGAAAVLLLPRDADGGDLAVLASALRRMADVRISRTTAVRVRGDRMQVIDATRFWAQPPAGHRRLWTTYPVAISESRPPRRSSWSVGDAALLSIGLVWRDHLGGLSRGSDRFQKLAASAASFGAEAVEGRRFDRAGTERYVHRVQPETLVQPYLATVSLGALAGDQTIVAIGQSRHLGGGLLLPVDRPDAS